MDALVSGSKFVWRICQLPSLKPTCSLLKKDPNPKRKCHRLQPSICKGENVSLRECTPQIHKFPTCHENSPYICIKMEYVITNCCKRAATHPIGSMGRTVYLPSCLPYKSTIHGSVNIPDSSHGIRHGHETFRMFPQTWEIPGYETT